MTENRFELPDDIAAPGGVLTDREIRTAVERGFLLTGDYSVDHIRQASYELRASGRVEELYHHDGVTDHQKLMPCDGKIVIHPGQTVKIFCMEDLLIPNNVLGHVLALGPLFALGLLGGSTYLDPGYNGEVFIAFTNVSSVTVRLPEGNPIARLEFEKLSGPCQNPHPGEPFVRTMEIGYTDPPLHQLAELNRRMVYLKVVLWFLMSLILATAWATVPPLLAGTSELVKRLQGGNVLMKYLLTTLVTSVLLVLRKEVRQLVREFVVALGQKWGGKTDG